MSDLPPITYGAVTVAALPASSVLLSVSADGNHVWIDWNEVEKQAKGEDRLLMPLSKALLAVRDGTYQSSKSQ